MRGEHRGVNELGEARNVEEDEGGRRKGYGRYNIQDMAAYYISPLIHHTLQFWVEHLDK